MGHQLARDDRAPSGVKDWQLWFSLLSGFVVWVIHLMIVYSLTSLACEWGWFPFTVVGLAGLKIVQIVVTVIAAMVIGLGGYYALRNRERLGDSEIPEANRHHFMVYLGLALSMLFFALVAISIIPILVLPACG